MIQTNKLTPWYCLSDWLSVVRQRINPEDVMSWTWVITSLRQKLPCDVVHCKKVFFFLFVLKYLSKNTHTVFHAVKWEKKINQVCHEAK